MLKTLGFTFLLCLLSGFAYADGVPVDPNMVVNDPICVSSQPCAPLVFSGVEFTFNANSTGGGTTSFEVNPNAPAGGVAPAFTTLDIETADPNGCTPTGDCTGVHCSSNEFECQVSLIGGITNIHLFIPCDGEICTSNGFVAGDVFTIDLDNPNTPDTGGWTPGEEFAAIGNLGTTPTTPFLTTPEPSSALMLFAGAAAFAARKKMMKRS